MAMHDSTSGKAGLSDLALMVEAGQRRAEPAPYQHILRQVREQVARAVNPAQLASPDEATREQVRGIAREVIARYRHTAPIQGLPPLGDEGEVLSRLLSDILGFGPLDELLRDPSVEEIIINGTEGAFVIDEHGKRPVRLDLGGPEDIIALVNRLVAPTGRQVTTTHPILDAQLPDGSRVNVTIAPVAQPSPLVTIRRHRLVARTIPDLVRLGTITEELGRFLTAAVRARLSILVAGGTATGKTNMVNVLAGLLPPEERVVVIEDTRELQIPLPDVAYLVVRPPNVEGKGAITQRRLVQNALRLRPDRIIVGEVRGAEAIDMLLAANTGHEGLICSVHANSCTEALRRLAQLCCLATDIGVPEKTVAEWIAGAFQLVIFLKLDAATGKRLVSEVVELTGQVEGTHILHQPIFQMADGRLVRTPYHLACAERMRERGVDPTPFQPGVRSYRGAAHVRP